jgi:hypothetical protein
MDEGGAERGRLLPRGLLPGGLLLEASERAAGSGFGGSFTFRPRSMTSVDTSIGASPWI